MPVDDDLFMQSLEQRFAAPEAPPEPEPVIQQEVEPPPPPEPTVDLQALTSPTPEIAPEPVPEDKPLDPFLSQMQERFMVPEPEPEEPAAFDPESADYDYDSAAAAGITADETGHWQSRKPLSTEEAGTAGLPIDSGLILKGMGHETIDKTRKGEEEAGYKIIKHTDGRYYSIPQIAPKKPVEPAAIEPEFEPAIANDPAIQKVLGIAKPEEEKMEIPLIEEPSFQRQVNAEYAGMSPEERRAEKLQFVALPEPLRLQHPVASLVYDATLGNVSRLHDGILGVVEQMQRGVAPDVIKENFPRETPEDEKHIGPLVAFGKAMMGLGETRYRDIMKNAGVKFVEDLSDEDIAKPWYSLPMLSKIGLEYAQAVGEFGSDPLVIYGAAKGRIASTRTIKALDGAKKKIFAAFISRGVDPKTAAVQSENLVNGAINYSMNPPIRTVEMEIIEGAGKTVVSPIEKGLINSLLTKKGKMPTPKGIQGFADKVDDFIRRGPMQPQQMKGMATPPPAPSPAAVQLAQKAASPAPKTPVSVTPLTAFDPAAATPEQQQEAIDKAIVGTGEYKPGEVYVQDTNYGIRPVQVTQVFPDGTVKGWYFGAASDAEIAQGVGLKSLQPAVFRNPKQELQVAPFEQSEFDTYRDLVFKGAEVTPEAPVAAEGEIAAEKVLPPEPGADIIEPAIEEVPSAQVTAEPGLTEETRIFGGTEVRNEEIQRRGSEEVLPASSFIRRSVKYSELKDSLQNVMPKGVQVAPTETGIDFVLPNGRVLKSTPSSGQIKAVDTGLHTESIIAARKGDLIDLKDGTTVLIPATMEAYMALPPITQDLIRNALPIQGMTVPGSGEFELDPVSFSDPYIQAHELTHDVEVLLSEPEANAVIEKYGNWEEIVAKATDGTELADDAADQVIQKIRQGKVFAREPGAEEGIVPRGTVAPERIDAQTQTEPFKKWFGDGAVVDEQGNPKRVFAGHANAELFGTRFDPRKATAGAFYFTEDPAIASSYATGKMGVKEYYEGGEEYKFRHPNTGNFSKRMYDIDLTPEQYEVFKNKWAESYGDWEAYLQENARYDANVRRASYRPQNLQSFHDIMSNMGDNIAYDTPGEGPSFLRQTKSTFEETMDEAGIQWESSRRYKPAVMPTYLNLQNPYDTSTPFPAEVMADLEAAVAGKRTPSWEKIDRTHWTKEYPLKAWVDDIKRQEATGEETFWATQVPKGADKFFQRHGYDGIKDVGGKMGGDQHAVYIAFEPTQIKSATGNRGTFDPSKPDIRYAVQQREMVSPDTVPDAEAAPPAIWKSTMYEVVDRKLPGSVAGPQLISLLNSMVKKGDIKKAELEESGLMDWARGVDGKVSKADVLSEIEQGMVQIEEVVKSDAPDSYQVVRDMPEMEDILFYAKNGGLNESDVNEMIENMGAGEWDQHMDIVMEYGGEGTREQIQEAMDIIQENALVGMDSPANTKYEDYQLPGGENYQEMLLTLPVGEEKLPEGFEISQLGDGSWRVISPGGSAAFGDTRDAAVARGRAMVGDSKDVYKSSHWDEPNVVAHVRYNDRTLPDGRKALHVEEIQSDWHQAGRKKGYDRAKELEELRSIDSDIDKIKEQFPKPEGMMEIEYSGEYLNSKSPEIVKLRERRRIENDRLLDKGIDTYRETGMGVPDAPFKKNWHELAMKRMLRKAVDEGYDVVTWTGGQEQADRYDLSQRIDELTVERNQDGTYNMNATLPGGGSQPVGNNVPENKLEDYVGKDLASKIAAQEARGDVYNADDLKVGGEGMKGFYDKMLPSFLKKYAKKWGGKVDITPLDAPPEGEVRELIDSDGIHIVEYGSESREFTDESEADAFAESIRKGTRPVHSLEITDKMRDAISTEAQPRYAVPRKKAEEARIAKALEQVPSEFEPGVPKEEELPPRVTEPMTQKERERRIVQMERAWQDRMRKEERATFQEAAKVQKQDAREIKREAVRQEREKAKFEKELMNEKIADVRRKRDIKTAEKQAAFAEQKQKIRQVSTDRQSRRDLIWDYAKEHLPAGEREAIFGKIKKATPTDKDLEDAVSRIDEIEEGLAQKKQAGRVKKLIKIVNRRLKTSSGKRVIRAEYAEALRDLVDSYSVTKPTAKTEETRAKMKQFFEDNPDLKEDLPPKIVDRLNKDAQIPLGELTVDDLTEIEASVLTLLKRNDLKGKLIRRQKWRDIDTAARESIEKMQTHRRSKSTLFTKPGAKEGAAPERRTLAKMVADPYNDIDFMTRVMDAQEDGPANELFYGELNKAENKRLSNLLELKASFRENLQRNGIDVSDPAVVNELFGMSDVLPSGRLSLEGAKEAAKKIPEIGKAEAREEIAERIKPSMTRTEVIDVPEVRDDAGRLVSEAKSLELTPGQKISLLLTAKDPDGWRSLSQAGENKLIFTDPEGILSREGKIEVPLGKITSADIEAVQASMTPMEESLMKTAHEFFQTDSKRLVNEATRATEGYDAATRPNYFPKKTVDDFRVKGQKGALVGKTFLQQTLEDMPLLQERKPGANSPVVIRDVVEVLEEAVSRVSALNAYAAPLRQIKSVMNWIGKGEDGKRISYMDELKKAYGEDWAKQLTTLIANVEGQSYSTDPFESFMGLLRNRAVGSILTLRPTVWVKQAISYPLSALELGYTNMSKALNPVLTPKQIDIAMDVVDRHPETANRLKHGMISRDIGDYAGRHFMQDFLADKKPSTEILGAGIRAGDAAAINRVAIASYYKAQEELGKAASKEELLDRSEYWLERAIKRTQPSWHLKDLSHINSSPNAAKRWFYTFRTFRDKMIKMQRMETLRYLESDRSKEAKANYARNMLFIFAVGAFLPAVVNHVKSAWQNRKKEKYADKEAMDHAIELGMRTIDNYLGNWFVVGEGGYQAIKQMAGKRRSYDRDILTSPVVSTANDVINLGADSVKMFQFMADEDIDEEKFEKAAYNMTKKANETIGRMIGKPLEGLWDMTETMTGGREE